VGTLGRGGAGCPDHGTLWAQPARLAPDLPRLAAWASLARPLWPRLGPPPSAALAGMLLGLGPRQPDPTAPAMPAMPALLPWLALTGWRVTLAARGGPTAIAEPIRAPGGDALGAWKSNHHKAATALKEPWHAPIAPQGVWRPAAHCFEACDAAHGRTVRRRGWPLPALPALTIWPGLHAGMVVETKRMARQQASGTRDSRIALARRPRSATACGTMMRPPWDMEHQRHGALAVTGKEDRCRIRQDPAPPHGAALRHMALNLRRQEPSRPMRLRQKRLLCGLDEHALLTMLSGGT